MKCLRSVSSWCHQGLLRGIWSPATISLTPLPLGGAMLLVPALTWHVPLASTLGTVPD